MGRAEVSVLLLESGYDLTSHTRSTGFGHAQELEMSGINME